VIFVKERKLVLKFVLFILLLYGIGCGNAKVEVNPPSVPSDYNSTLKIKVKRKIAEINTILNTGIMFEDAGYYEDAMNYLNKAVEETQNQPDEISTNPDFVRFKKTLIENVQNVEAFMVANNDYDDSSDVKDEILDDGDIVISKKEERKEKKFVETSKEKYSFPVVINDKVLAFIKAYTTKLRPVIQASLERSGRYIELYRNIFKKEGLPEDLAYLPLIESGFKIHAYSRARAKGIWQFMKGTARLEGLRVDWWVDERCDPEKSAIAAAKHLKKLYEHYNDWYLTIAAYNAGQGRIDRAIKRAKTRDFWKIAKKRWLLRRETKNYVPAFIAALIIAKNPERYGFKDLNYQTPLEYDTVTVDSCTDLRVIARLCDTTVDEIRKLNPHLRRFTTPIRDKNFTLNVPKGKGKQFLAKFKKLPKNRRVTLRYHRIRKGETLSQIARMYKTTVTAICRANRIRNKRLIRAGKTIIIPIGNGRDLYIPRVKDYTVAGRRLGYRRGRKIIHRVRRGDSLFKIAVRYRTDVESLKKWNNLSSSFLKPGQKLVVYYGVRINRHKDVKKGGKSLNQGYYVVKEGDTLYSISRKFGLSVSSLKKKNGIRSNLIKPGDVIKVGDI